MGSLIAPHLQGAPEKNDRKITSWTPKLDLKNLTNLLNLSLSQKSLPPQKFQFSISPPDIIYQQVDGFPKFWPPEPREKILMWLLRQRAKDVGASSEARTWKDKIGQPIASSDARGYEEDIGPVIVSSEARGWVWDICASIASSEARG